MSALAPLLTHPLVEGLGLTLLHSLWQLVLVALLLLLALRRLPLTRPNLRYGLGCAALMAMVLLPVTTLLGLTFSPSVAITAPASPEATTPTGASLTSNDGSFAGGAAHPPGPPALSLDSEPATFLQWLAQRLRPEPLLPWLGLLWLAGTLLQSFRLAGSLLVTYQLKATATRLAPQDLQASLVHLSRRLGIKKRVRLFTSPMVEVPLVIGWLKPMVLLPASALTGLTRVQLEVLVAHELTHIRRHDYLVNLLQSSIEALLFYHPAVWWVSEQVRREREHCCDDLAITLCEGDRVTYAKALVNLERLRALAHPLALAANGGSLLNRIKRIAQHPISPTTTPAPTSVVTLVLLLGFVMATLVLTPGLAQVQGEAAVQNRVVIDPGHSSLQPDARSSDGTLGEEDLVLDISHRLRDLLVEEGIEVILTGSGNESFTDAPTEDDAARASLAAPDADLFLSIYAVAATQPTLHGISTQYYQPLGEVHRASTSAMLAEVLHEHLVQATGAYDRGIRGGPSTLLENVPTPAALVEVGFLTHPEEARRLATSEYQDTLATAMAGAIMVFLSYRPVAIAPGMDPYPLVPTQAPTAGGRSDLQPVSVNAAGSGDLVPVDVAGADLEGATAVTAVEAQQATPASGNLRATEWRLQKPIIYGVPHEELFDTVLRGLNEVRFEAIRASVPAESVEVQFSATSRDREAGVITAAFEQFTLSITVRPFDEEHAVLSLSPIGANPPDVASYSLPIHQLYLSRLVAWLDVHLNRVE